MVRNSKKIVSLIMTLSILLTMSTTVLAGLIPNPTPVLPGGGMDGMVSSLLGLLQACGYAVAVGMLIYVGIKYVMASANEKADLKNSSIRYLIGAIILLSVSAVFGIIEKTITQVIGSTPAT